MAITAKKKAAAKAKQAAEAAQEAPKPVRPVCNCLASIRPRSMHAIGCPLMGIDD